jgi:transposase-like protein
LNFKQTATQFINGLTEAEFPLFIGRDNDHRDSVKISSRNLRNGHYQRSFVVKGLGKLLVKVPRDRSEKFKTKALEPYRRMEASLEEDVAVFFLVSSPNSASASQRFSAVFKEESIPAFFRF